MSMLASNASFSSLLVVFRCQNQQPSTLSSDGAGLSLSIGNLRRPITRYTRRTLGLLGCCRGRSSFWSFSRSHYRRRNIDIDCLWSQFGPCMEVIASCSYQENSHTLCAREPPSPPPPGTKIAEGRGGGHLKLLLLFRILQSPRVCCSHCWRVCVCVCTPACFV